MTRYRYHLTSHAKEETIPLRTGIIPKLSKVFLDEIEIDEEGTAQQTKSQRDTGNYHILANVWLSEFGEDRLPGRWRLVTVEPDHDGIDPPIITLLPPDRSSARSEANLTDFLKKERQKDDKPWLTTEYIAKTLHPLLKDGRIRNQNDLSNHLNTVLMMPILKAKEAAERKSFEDKLARENSEHARETFEKEVLIAREETKKAVNEKDLAETLSLDFLQEKEIAEKKAIEAQKEKELADKRAAEAKQGEDRAIDRAESEKQTANEEKEKNKIHVKEKDVLANENEQMRKALEAINERPKIGNNKESLLEVARAVTRPWPSKIPGSVYMNIGIEANIVDVYKTGSSISLTYIDKSGRNQTVTDFGYQGFVQLVYDYLMSCKVANQRAVFILTYKPDMKMRLAADTMMLGTYVNLWRNK